MKHHKRGEAQMELFITALADGDHSFAFTAPAAAIGLDEFLGEVTANGTVRRLAHEIIVAAQLAGGIARECDRCLAETEIPVEADLSLYYHITVPGERTSQVDDQEIRELPGNHDSIILDEEARQALLLAIPLKTLCRDDCKGICPGCGADLNNEQCSCSTTEIDPRWQGLAGLFQKGEEEGN
ncbi:MAG: DUF177 domain-containing protein [Armatimonadetes bacterium]|nr:DUF177 domain-containing protein [Armatimonadota bacterium]